MHGETTSAGLEDSIDVIKFLLCCASIGQFQKISVQYDGRLFGIPKARGVLSTGIPKAWRGTYDWNSEGIGGFQTWDFQRLQTSDFVGFPFPIQGTSFNECC